MAEQNEMIERLEEHDGLSGLRNALRSLARDRDHWAGIPLPIDGLPLVIEPSYPYAKGLMELKMASDRTLEAQKEEEFRKEVKVRNSFYSLKYKTWVTVFEYRGKIYKQPGISGNRATLEFNTLMASDAWGIEQESRAIHLLATLVGHRKFKQYLLTGMFLERSARSNVTYMFRRLRPTLAIHSVEGESVRILCAMCMHPIGFYGMSWAGAMCPTDDVIAHLSLMRGDEPMFWRRCNQHAPHLPAAGLG